MSLAISNEQKNTVAITNENKPSGTTWADATYTWAQADGTWAEPGTIITKESKNNITITNENKT